MYCNGMVVLRQYCSPIFDLDNMTKSFDIKVNLILPRLVGQRDQIEFFQKRMVYHL